jgi:hypothetical protein
LNFANQAEQPAAGKNRCADDKERKISQPGQPKGLDALIANISEKLPMAISLLMCSHDLIQKV